MEEKPIKEAGSPHPNCNASAQWRPTKDGEEALGVIRVLGLGMEQAQAASFLSIQGEPLVLPVCPAMTVAQTGLRALEGCPGKQLSISSWQSVSFHPLSCHFWACLLSKSTSSQGSVNALSS